MRRCASQPLVRRAAPTPSSSPRTKSVRASSGTGASDGELLGLADPVPVGVPLGVAVELVGTAPSGGDTAGVDVVEPAAGPAEPEEPVAADAPVSAVARGTPVLSSIPHLLRLPLPAPLLSATLGEDDRVVVGRHDEDGFLRSCAAPWWRGTRFGQVTSVPAARV